MIGDENRKLTYYRVHAHNLVMRRVTVDAEVLGEIPFETALRSFKGRAFQEVHRR